MQIRARLSPTVIGLNQSINHREIFGIRFVKVVDNYQVMAVMFATSCGQCFKAIARCNGQITGISKITLPSQYWFAVSRLHLAEYRNRSYLGCDLVDNRRRTGYSVISWFRIVVFQHRHKKERMTQEVMMALFRQRYQPLLQIHSPHARLRGAVVRS